MLMGNGSNFKYKDFTGNISAELNKVIDNCCYCGCELTIKIYTKDHLVAKSKGGNNLKANKRACCYGCNMEKGNMSLEEYAEKISLILTGFLTQNRRKKLKEKLIRIKHLMNYVKHMGRRLYT